MKNTHKKQGVERLYYRLTGFWSVEFKDYIGEIFYWISDFTLDYSIYTSRFNPSRIPLYVGMSRNNQFF